MGKVDNEKVICYIIYVIGNILRFWRARMNLKEVFNNENVSFSGVPTCLFLLGLLSAFDNRYQAKADAFFEEISWKQFFAIICISLCQENPTINEIAGIMGSSHQNVKQILLKLENKGFVNILTDTNDKRKQRIVLSEKTKYFCKKNEEESNKVVQKIFQGISELQLQETIKTIIQMENNLNNL